MGKHPFKILCIDGGGIKGLFSAQILAKFEEVYDTKISEQFDLICGTSTGGIIALAASANISICYKGKYSNEELRKALAEVFKDKKIYESSNLLCIPAFDIITATPRVFKRDYKKFTEDNKKTYVDVALATSAAPTYLPIHNLESSQYVDGGVWANNPSLVGLMEFLYQFANDERFNGVDILSISSLEVAQGNAPKRNYNSFIDWNENLIELFSIGQAKNMTKLFEFLDGKLKFPMNYVRITNEPLSAEHMRNISMDNASDRSLKILQSIGNATAIKAKMDPKVERFFTTGKTLYF